MGRYRLTVYDTEISGLFDAFGAVGRPISQLQREVFTEAVATSPFRSGSIARSHINRGALKAGPYRIRGSIENTSDHARYVHEGTHGPIFPTSGRLLILRGGMTSFPIWKPWVRGQSANPWMTRAASTVLSRHGI